MPIGQLKEIAAAIIAKYPGLEKSEALFQEEEKKLVKLREERQGIVNKIEEIRSRARKRKEQEYENAGTFRKFFMDRQRTVFTEHEKAELRRLENIITNKFKSGYDKNKYSIEYWEYERLQRIQRHISQRERKEAKKSTDRAVIAAYKGKSRILAQQVKSDLKKQMRIDSHCPYCGHNMSNDTRCDHIYPVSKGGLSTPKNMVYVCSDCNSKKFNLTLFQFIKKYNLVRVDIERRLEKLGKDY
jgi:5-methylcytosine-specific restriction endonuclease McrA